MKLFIFGHYPFLGYNGRGIVVRAGSLKDAQEILRAARTDQGSRYVEPDDVDKDLFWDELDAEGPPGILLV